MLKRKIPINPIKVRSLRHIARFSGWQLILFVAVFAGIGGYLILHSSASSPTILASDVLGQTHGTAATPNFTDFNNNDTPPANHIGLNNNSGVALDTANHRLFVADEGNSRVLVYNLDASNHFTSNSANFAIGQAGFANDALDHTNSCVFFGQSGIPMPSRNQLCAPDSLAYDPAHNRLFVGDTGWDRVLVFDLSAGISNDMIPSYVLGQLDFTSATSSANCAGSPTRNNLCFGTNGNAASGLAYDSANQRLFVGEAARIRVMVFDLSHGITNGMNAANVLGQLDFTSHAVNVTRNGLSSAGAVFYDSVNQRLFAADSQRMMIYNLAGGVTDGMNAANVLGQPDFTTNGCSNPPTPSSVCGPAGFFYDSAGSKLYVSDTSGSRVLVYNLAGGVTDGMNAANVLGQANFTSSAFATTQSSLFVPAGLVYDTSNQQLIVNDSRNNRIMTYDLSTAIINGMSASHEEGQVDYLGNSNYTLRANDNSSPNPHGFGGAGGTLAQAVAEDPVHHRLYVTDNTNERVLVYNLDSSNHLISHSANYVLGQPDFLTSYQTNCATARTICEPVALEVDTANDRLFVGDYTQSRVLVYNFSGGISNNMDASYVLGQLNMTTVGEHCNGQAGRNNFCDVIGLGYDPSNTRLYVAEEGGSRVMAFNVNPATIANGQDATHVLGQAGFTSETCSYNTANGMCSPENLSYDSTDKLLFVTEDDSQRIQVFDMSNGISNNMNASWAIGQPDFTTTTRHCLNAATQSGLCGPFGRVSYDAASKRIFVPDTYNDRILVFNASGGFSSGMKARYVIGTADSQDFTHDGIGNVNGNSNYTQNSVVGPDGTYYDSATGKLYVADQYNDRIMIFDIGVHITTASLPNGTKDTPYSQTVQISNASGAVTFNVSTGSLPAGLSLNSATGLISGTPTVSGTYNFTIQASDASGENDSKTYSIDIIDSGSILSVSLSASPNTISSGQSSTITWSVTGNPSSCSKQMASTSFATDPSWTGNATFPSGSLQVTPPPNITEEYITYNYEITCSDPTNTSSSEVTVSMSPISGGVAGGCAVNNHSPVVLAAACKAARTVYQDPFRAIKNLANSRIDQGVDYYGDGPVYAIGNGKIKIASTTAGWPGGTFIVYQLTNGPAKGLWIYVAEDCRINTNPKTKAKYKVGDAVTSNSAICTTFTLADVSKAHGIETGWATQDGSTTAAAVNEYSTATCPHGAAMTYGVNFSRLMWAINPVNAGNRGLSTPSKNTGPNGCGTPLPNPPYLNWKPNML